MAFYTRLQSAYPDYNIIEMLPIENISKINFKAPHFYSQDIRDMAARYFVDNHRTIVTLTTKKEVTK